MRPTLDQYLMELAMVAAKRTTCIRRGVGCVLADSKGRVLSIGYNGVPAGMPHCNESKLEPGGYEHAYHIEVDGKQVEVKRPTHMVTVYPNACKGHDLPPGQDDCLSVHAEQNAILQCLEPDRIHTAYVTLSPCKACCKLLMNTGCQRIVILEEHSDLWAKEQWLKLGREWRLLEMPK